MMTSHPTEEELGLYAMGAGEDLPVDMIERHVAQCDACAAAVAREARLELALFELAQHTPLCPGCQRPAGDGPCAHCGAVLRAGGFEIRKVLVQNAHGRLYLADGPDGKRVALKELVFVQAPDAAAQMRFEREASFLRALSHRLIPRFVASFQQGDGVQTRMFLAQEFVEGASLEARLVDHWFDEDEIVDIARQVLEVLVYLQSLSPMVFHGDIKPANLIRRPDGSIVLVDFGAARALGATAGSTLMGTFGYMPVEQLAGAIDPTTDLYALGASLTHLLSRQEPWRLHEDPAFLSRINASPALRRYLGKLMARNPNDRFANARQALTGLDHLYDSPPRRKTATRVALAAGVLLAAGVGSMATLRILEHTRAAHRPSYATAPMDFEEPEPEPPTPPPVASLSSSDCHFGVLDVNPKCRSGELVALHHVDETSSLMSYSFDQGFLRTSAVPVPGGMAHMVQDPKTGIWYGVRDSVFGAVRVGIDPAFSSPITFFQSLERPPAPALGSPTAVAFDSKRRRVLVVADSPGLFAPHEEGRQLFAYQPDDGRWSLLGHLGGAELVAMAYVPTDDLFYGLDESGTFFRVNGNGALLDKRMLAPALGPYEQVQLIAVGDRLAVFVHRDEDDDNDDDEDNDKDGNAKAKAAVAKAIAKARRPSSSCLLIDPRSLQVLKNVSPCDR